MNIGSLQVNEIGGQTDNEKRDKFKRNSKSNILLRKGTHIGIAVTNF